MLEVNASHSSRPTTPNVKMIAINIYFFIIYGAPLYSLY